MGIRSKWHDPLFMTPGARYSAVALLLIVGVVAVTSLLFTVNAVSADDRKWCDTMTLLTSHPVSRPANPAANPSREQNYQFYETFVHLRRSLGC